MAIIKERREDGTEIIYTDFGGFDGFDDFAAHFIKVGAVIVLIVLLIQYIFNI